MGADNKKKEGEVEGLAWWRSIIRRRRGSGAEAVVTRGGGIEEAGEAVGIEGKGG
jgi:hypothetical protein